MHDQPAAPEPKPLLGAELWPITGAYAFFDAAIGEVAEVLAAWRRGLDLQPVELGVVGPLREVLSALEPMSLGNRELLLGTRSDWTAYFSNQHTGADEAPVGVIAEMMRCRAVYIVWWPVPSHETLRFQLIADHPTDFLNHERTVHVGRDDGGRLVFVATGRPQPYEDLRSYGARRVADRLTPALVDRYCRAIGLRPFDESFYGLEGLLITTRDFRPDLSYTIADEQARYGFKPPVE